VPRVVSDLARCPCRGGRPAAPHVHLFVVASQAPCPTGAIVPPPQAPCPTRAFFFLVPPTPCPAGAIIFAAPPLPLQGRAVLMHSFLSFSSYSPLPRASNRREWHRSGDGRGPLHSMARSMTRVRLSAVPLRGPPGSAVARRPPWPAARRVLTCVYAVSKRATAGRACYAAP
jgi:hypothetical protein